MATIVPISNAPKRGGQLSQREKIVQAVVALITDEGFSAVGPRRIAEYAGVSVGVVQSQFGSRGALFETVLEQCHVLFMALVENDELLIGDLEERAAMFVALSWRHYQSDLYLATVEILMATRTQREMGSLIALTEQQGERQRNRVREIFPECPLDDRALMEVLISVHCFLTGLTVETVLEPRLVNIGGYLKRATGLMVSMLLTPPHP